MRWYASVLCVTYRLFNFSLFTENVCVTDTYLNAFSVEKIDTFLGNGENLSWRSQF